MLIFQNNNFSHSTHPHPQNSIPPTLSYQMQQHLLLRFNDMKKNREGKQNKRNGANFFKYVQPPTTALSQQSKNHVRSLIELDQNTSRYQQSARITSNKAIHHTSLETPTQAIQNQTIKSHSLKKFLSIFGGPASLNQNSYRRIIDEKQTSKGSGRQVFTCNIKNMNFNVTNSKQQEQKQTTPLLISRKGKNQGSFNFQPPKPQEHETIAELKKIINEGKDRQGKLKREVQFLGREKETLKKNIQNKDMELQKIQQKAYQTQNELQAKIEQLQKKIASKQKCKQHQLIIESLKKVINEQLKKIIELQKLKVEREEIDKLQEKINKNINLNQSYSNLQKLKLVENNPFLSARRKNRTIIIEQSNIQDQQAHFLTQQPQLYTQTIEEATEEQQRDSMLRAQESPQDSILEEVDKYLAQWRSRA